MCESNNDTIIRENEGYNINFNQDFTSLTVSSETGYRIFGLTSVNRIDEQYCCNEGTKIVERLFSSHLLAVVTDKSPCQLKMYLYNKGTEICNNSYSSPILSIHMNRTRLIVCLCDSIYIHNMRDMKSLHSIRHIAPNDNGLCCLSQNSHLAFPISSKNGELQIFDGKDLQTTLQIKAHQSLLSAMNFSPNGLLIATASEKGTVIRVFCVKNGQKVHEFRRGVKRYVNIASLHFSNCANYICVSSNTETVHVFKINIKDVENAERQNCIDSNVTNNNFNNNNNNNNNRNLINPNDDSNNVLNKNNINSNNNQSNNNNNNNNHSSSSSSSSTSDLDCTNSVANESRWSMDYITKAMTSYFPSQVSDVLNQDRAFATVQLMQPGLKYNCVLTRIETEMKILAACEDGFLYIYNFDDAKGGECKLVRVHDLRGALVGITEVNIDDNDCDMNTLTPATVPIETITTKSISTGTYASVLKGRNKDIMSDSAKCRDLSEAIDYPPKTIFDEVQFPAIINAD